MMILPSGRPNSDVRPIQNPKFMTSASSPQLPLTPPTSISGLTGDNDFLTAVQSSTRKALPSLLSAETKKDDQILTNKIFSECGPGTSPRLKTAATTGAAPTTTSSQVVITNSECARNCQDVASQLDIIQRRIRDGWTVHAGKDGRLYYCNHLTKTSSWLPPCEDWSCSEQLPYGWERAVDSKGRPYYINHLNKTSTYEAPENVRWEENRPEPRVVELQRSLTLGFGFVAGSERPVIVRFVTDGGPSMNKLQPGDQILAVNGEDVKEAPRDHVIQLVRACESKVTLLVSQPVHTFAPGRKSTLLSAGKRAKLRTRPSRVRFAESVCVNGAPLFPPSAFSLGDICVPPMANVLKVFLENGQTKSFKYDATTTVQDVVTSLLDKLCLSTGEIFSLVLEHVKSLKRNKLTLLDPDESLARIAARPGAHKLRCLFRVTFMPVSAADLAQKDLNSLDYFYMQCCNDVTQERFAPELQPEVALRLAALHIHQHALANNVCPAKLTVKVVEREFGLERFIPSTLFEGMKRKELRRLISHFLKLNAEMTGSSTKVLTQLQAKLHYLDIITSLPSYGAKCFSTNQRECVERVLLVSPRFGLSQISSARNSAPQLISNIDDFNHVIVHRDDDVTCSVAIFLRSERICKFIMEERDACEFSLVLAGYYRLITGKELSVDRDREHCDEDNAPSYLAQHTVLPASWSYLKSFHKHPHSMNFLMPPPYHVKVSSASKWSSSADEGSTTSDMKAVKSSDISNDMPAALLSSNSTDLDIHSVMATELLEEAKDSDLNESGEGECNLKFASDENRGQSVEAKNEEIRRRVHEMQEMVENSEQYLTEQEEHLNESFSPQQRNSGSPNCWPYGSLRNSNNALKKKTAAEFDSDGESLNSSKISYTEDILKQSLKHSDSLVLLAEAINQDLSGIAQGLNSIGSSKNNSHIKGCPISPMPSPRPERKLDGFCQLLNNLQALGNDFSQSESDSESVQSPTHSPTARRPTLLQSNENASCKQMNAYRCSFGLHSPDGGNFGAETKDYNLKEYLKQLKEISQADDVNQDTTVAAKKLSEIYGFEIHEDTFIEVDSDLIDLRALPPPRTPDELDALSLLSAAPQGFADGFNKSNGTVDAKEDLDRFLEKVVVGPPTQRTTPSKELTPEEINSFIIPPPPNLEFSGKEREDKIEECNSVPMSEVVSNKESLYSNSTSMHTNRQQNQNISRPQAKEKHSNSNHVIEYSTVDRKNKFSCCPKSKKDEAHMPKITDPGLSDKSIQIPPRRSIKSVEIPPPVRPPKSDAISSRYSPKKQLPFVTTPQSFQNIKRCFEATTTEEFPPAIPPRLSPIRRSGNDICMSSTARPASKKPPLPSISPRQSNQCQSVFKPPSSSFLNADSPSLSYSNNTNTIRSCQSTQPSSSKLCSPESMRKTQNLIPSQCDGRQQPSPHIDKLIMKNGHVIDGKALLAKTDVAMTGLLVKLDHVAAQCTAAQSAGGGSSINEEKFQRARNELTEQTLALVTSSKFLVMAMSDVKLTMLLEHLTSCLTAIRRITELTENMTCHTSAPLQTRNIVLKVHDVASSFRELVGVQIGPQGAGQLALQAECLANMLATLLRSLRVFSP